MAILINAHELKKSYTARPLFEGITFSIESGERIGLIGPNGAGKSTLLKILAGRTQPDEGTLAAQRGLRIGFLEQVPGFTPQATVESSVLEGARDPHDWNEISEAQKIMAKLDLNRQASQPVERLSGGWRKRVALARELLKHPDLLLLDEPTNHLDIESILWLEELIASSNFATVTITHDRLFLQRVSSRIIELDRRHAHGLLSINGDYATYLETRAELLGAQELHEQKLRNTLRRETEWLRRGAKARLTKQQARIQNHAELSTKLEELETRNRVASAKIEFQTLEKNPKKLIEAKNISKSYIGKTVVPALSLTITPKSRIGLMGPNGCGKSTLIKLLTGKEKPDTGQINFAEKLQVSYFEQNRESLDPNATLYQVISPGGEYIDHRGTRVHVKSYLSRFLFSYEQMGLPVAKLSGGEQSRLLIAKLMLREANVLVLDEPTNDLDIETLDVLQEVLQEFDGAVILVSHDRYFLDQVTPNILAFGLSEKGEKAITPLTGLDQWEAWHELQSELAREFETARSKAPPQPATPANPASAAPKKKKLSYKDQRELDSMEETIQKAEERLAHLTAESTKPENISNAARLTELTRQMSEAQAEVDRLYQRWAELES